MPVVQRLQKIVKTVKSWSAESIDCLRGFDCTDWQMFYDSTSDLNDLADVISSYVTHSDNILIPAKQTGD